MRLFGGFNHLRRKFARGVWSEHYYELSCTLMCEHLSTCAEHPIRGSVLFQRVDHEVFLYVVRG